MSPISIQPALQQVPGAALAEAPPSPLWRTLAVGCEGPKLPKGLDVAWDALMGVGGRFVPRTAAFMRRAERIAAMEGTLTDASDARLRERLAELRVVFRLGRETSGHVEEAFALVREVSARQLGLRHHPAQVAAALALEARCVAELATGEGKTLSATMPAVIAGWRGRGCHVVTVNDYLAQRDAQWMGPIYRFCGLSVANIDQETPPHERRRAYLADVTYLTNKEATADFLRDRLVLGGQANLTQALLERMLSPRGPSRLAHLVQRGLEQAIVDEADSVLIDEAVTPLIISSEAPNNEQVRTYQEAAGLARALAAPGDYRIDQRFREVNLTPAGRTKLGEQSHGLGGVWAGRRRREELIEQALSARELFQPGKQYVVREGKVVIVDEFTGRLMPDRTWRDGLHQAVEAKEGLEVTPVKETLARISFQRFFRLYRKLSGMTGTARESWLELWRTYHLPVAVIPTHRPCIRARLADRLFATADAKWRAIVEEVQAVHAVGRPILVGTRSVAASEHLSGLLQAQGLEHEMLNAVRHELEAQIVAGAGQRGKITVATNMAGRGTDIKLGSGVAQAGGLHVIATERHESGRVDRQLFGRAGRQGDPGSAVAYASLEDELLARYAARSAVAGLKRMGDDRGVIRAGWAGRVVDAAQNRAQRLARGQRAAVLKTDDWLDEFLGFTGPRKF